MIRYVGKWGPTAASLEEFVNDRGGDGKLAELLADAGVLGEEDLFMTYARCDESWIESLRDDQ